MLFTNRTDNGIVAAKAHLVVFAPIAETEPSLHNILVPLPPSYTEAIEIIRRKYHVPRNSFITFRTRALQGCEGQVVVIEEETWEAITPILPMIEVHITKNLTAYTWNSDTEVSAPSEGPLNNNEMAAATPVTNITLGASASIQQREEPLVPSNKQKASKSARAIQLSAAAVPSSSNPSIALPQVSIKSSTFPSSATFTTPRTSTTGRRKSHSKRKASKAFEDEDEEQPKSPKKQGARRRVVSEGDPGEEEENTHKQASQEREDVNMIDLEAEEYDGEEEEEEEEEIDDGEMEEEALVEDQIKPASARNTKRDYEDEPISIGARAKTPSAVTRSEPNTPAAILKTPKTKKPLTITDLQLSPLQSLDKSFEVSIEYDNGQFIDASRFKTKGRHQVHKVILTACKLFELEEHYDSAKLSLVHEVEMDGEKQLMEFECQRNQTMVEAGAREDSVFWLTID